MVQKTEKLIEKSQKETKDSMATLRDKANSNADSLEGNKKQITMLGEKLQTIIKNAALAGNTSMGGGNVVQDIEDAIEKLQTDLEVHKKQSDVDLKMIKNETYDKASKGDIQAMDNQFTERVQQMFNTVTEINLEKEAQRKKTNTLNRKVSRDNKT